MLVKSIVNRPTTLLTIFLLLVGFGLYVAIDLPIDLYPEVTPPFLSVITTYPGAGPEEVEKVITRLVESVLSNASSLEKVSSSSSEGASQVSLEFTYGTNMDEASNDVRDKLERIKQSLPAGATLPQIFKFDTSSIPILNLMVKGNRSPEELRELAEKSIVPRLEQVSGVALASIRGGRARAVMVEIPQNRLAAYNLTITQIAQMLKGQNIQVPAGSITEGTKDYLIRTSGEYQNIDEIKNTVIAYRSTAANPGASGSGVRTILLRDIANVYDSYKRDDSRVFIDGKPGVYISVQKQSGKNSVQTADNVIQRLPRITAALPRDISFEVLNDTTKIIRSSLASVSSSAVSGGMLAVIILFIFLRSFKTTFIIATAIPVSIIVTLMCMYLAGLTLNLMTLTGLALGIGMLVDNSIVILENIYRYREKGAKLTTAAMLGGTEMILPIAGSTLTTIVVFAPIVVFKQQLGFMGEMLAAMSFTIVISLSISLIVAVLLVPILASKYLPISSRKEEPLKGLRKKFDDFLGGFFDWLDRAYKSTLGLMLRHRVFTILLILVVFAGSLCLIPLRGFEFMPSFEEDAVNVNIELPIGTKLDITETVLKQIELVVREEVKGFNNITITAGSRSAWGQGAVQTHRGSVTIRLPAFKERIDTANVIKNKLRRHFNDFPSVVFSFRDSHGFGGSNASPIDVIVRSNDLVKGKQTADQIRELIRKNVKQVTEPVVSLKDGLPQVEIFVDRNKAYDLGLSITAIGQEIQANIDGIISSKYRTEGTEYDIVAILDPMDRSKLPDIDKIFVMNSSGKRIPLASIAHYERTTGPLTIQRENQGRIIHVTGGIVPGTDINSTETEIRNMIAREVPADENIVIEFSGDFANMVKFGNKLLILFVISILLVYGIMASLFENFLDPFIIMFTMPLTATGVIAIHILTDLNFSMFTLIGLITLAGVVVNNGIVLVDYTNLMRKRGMKLFDAIPYAGGHRLRPVLMTSLTTMLALVPMAFDKGEGLDLIRPIGLTILGGMAVSTFFTLFLIPLIYSYFMQYADKLHLKRAAKWQKKMEARRDTLTRTLAAEHLQHEEPKEGSA